MSALSSRRPAFHRVRGTARRASTKPLAATNPPLLFSLFTMLAFAPRYVSVNEVNVGAVLVLFMAFTIVANWRSVAVIFRRSTPVSLLSISAILVGLFALFSASYAAEPFRVLRVAYAQIIGPIILLYVFIGVRSGSAALRACWLLVVLAALSSCIAFAAFQMPSLGRIFFGASDRTAALFKQANQFGIVLSMVLPLSAALLLSMRGRLRLLAALCTLAIYLGLALSGSKANLMIATALAGGVLIMYLANQGHFTRNPLLSFSLMGVAVAACLIGYNALDILNPRAKHLLDSFAGGEVIPSWAHREAIWDAAIATGLEHPLLGQGAGQLGLGGVTHSHNVFLDAFRTLGVPGLAGVVLEVGCVMVMLIPIIAHGFKGRLPLLPAATAAGCLAYIIANQSSDSFGPSTIPIFWIVLALTLVMAARPTAPPVAHRRYRRLAT
jgi:O-antigen ligase